jgi:hypothetical protein
MTQRSFSHQIPLWHPRGEIFGATGSNLSNATHWAGANFCAAVTGTIDRICFTTGNTVTFDGEIVGAITALDSNGYPLGTDVGASSPMADPPFAANTPYELTVSASVTAGTWYGVIIRISSYTSGTLTVQRTASGLYQTLAYSTGFPFSSENITGTPSKGTLSPLGVRYGSTLGYLPTYGLGAVPGSFNDSTAANSGDCLGNRFVLDRPVTLAGYVFLADADNDPTVAIFAGSDNTALSGTSVTITSALRRIDATGWMWIVLPTPVRLLPGTYRVALKNASAAAIPTIVGGRYILSNYRKQIFGYAEPMKTRYTSGAWTDTNTEVIAIAPVIYAMPDDSPVASYQLGM